MTQTLVVQQVRKLVELQKIDSEIYRLKKELEERPAYLAQLQHEFEGKKTHLKELEDRHKGIQVQRKGEEVELQAKEEMMAKANVQLSQIKTNKEYTAKMTEIENIKADKSLIEEKILQFYEEADGVKAQIDKEKLVVAEEERKYLAEKAKIEAAVKELEDRATVFKAQRQQALPGLEKKNLSRYERILANKEGLAIVPVNNGSCGGCHMHLPPQVINEMKMHDHLVYCETCARILYLEEDL